MVPVRHYLELLATYLRPLRRRVARLVVVLVAAVAVKLAIPQVIRSIIDGALSGSPAADLAMLASAVVGLAVGHQALSVAATWIAEDVGWRATNDLREDLADHVLHLDVAFHKDHPPGELIERVDGDVTALSNFFSAMVVKVVANLVLIVGIVVLLARESWLVGLVTAALLAAGLAAVVRLHAVAVPWWRADRAIAAETFGQVGEQVEGTEDIVANGATGFMQEQFAARLRRWMPLRVRGWTGWGLMWSTSEVLHTAMVVTVFVLGARFLGVGTVTIGGIYLMLHYAEMVAEPLHQIREQMQDLQKAGAAVARVDELVATTSSLRPQGRGRLPQGALSVAFEDVHFAYDDNGDGAATRVLSALDLAVEPGRVLGILGRTGSGKTTVARLVTRLYDVDRGVVRIGGHDVATVADLRERVAMVTQDVQLFAATVRDNLALFDPSIDDDQLHAALDTLGLHDWLDRLPDGLDTVLGANGAGMSAGQAQLLAFTRVFLRDPGLVVLDEASSRLDPATEALLEHAIERLLADRTGIIIAHRLHTLARADDVLVMEQGRVLEHGDRERLARNPSSHYARLLATGMEEVLT